MDAYMDIILRLLCLPCVFVGFGEGVCTGMLVSKGSIKWMTSSKAVRIAAS